MSSYWALPRKDQIALLVLCRLTEPLAYTSIAPYIYPMVRHMSTSGPGTADASPARISTLATLVVSAFALGQALTGVFWGRFSDRLGRKPALLLGLVGTAASTVMFGVSQSVAWAVVARLLAGSLNGNVGVMRTMIAELIGDQRQHQTRAFAILPITFNIGSILGPMAGGILADPASTYPALFGSSQFLRKYPYILPNLFVLPIVAVALVATALFVEETGSSPNLLLPTWSDPGLALGDRLLGRAAERRAQEYMALPPSEEIFLEDEPSETETETDTDSTSTSDDETAAKAIASPPPTPLSPTARTHVSLRSVLTRPVRITLACFTFLMLHSPTYLQLMPVFLSTPQLLDPEPGHKTHGIFFNGGLGWSTARIGVLMAVLGATGISLQLLVYPRVANWLGNARVHRLSLFLFPVSYGLTPFLALLPHAPGAVQEHATLATVLAALLGVLVMVARTFANPPMTILMTNAVADKAVLGTVHGLTHSVTSIARCLGPFVLGNLYSLGLKAGVVGLAWWTMVAVVGVEIWVARDLKEWGAYGADENEEQEQTERR